MIFLKMFMGGIGTGDDPLINMMQGNSMNNMNNMNNGSNINGLSGMFPPGMQGNIHVFQNGMPMNFNQFQKPEAISKNIEITLEQAYTGCTLPLMVERWIHDKASKRTEKETIYVTIPAGIDTNELLVIKNKGNILQESNKGRYKNFYKC